MKPLGFFTHYFTCLSLSLCFLQPLDAGALDAFGEASQSAQVVFIGAFDDLDVDHGLHNVRYLNTGYSTKQVIN